LMCKPSQLMRAFIKESKKSLRIFSIRCSRPGFASIISSYLFEILRHHDLITDTTLMEVLPMSVTNEVILDTFASWTKVVMLEIFTIVATMGARWCMWKMRFKRILS
jgi:hypothetical protein